MWGRQYGAEVATDPMTALDGVVRLFARVPSGAQDRAAVVDAVETARAQGVDGVEIEVHRTLDGVAVVTTAASFGPRLRRRRVVATAFDDLPAPLATVDEVLGLDPEAEVAAMVADPTAFEAIAAANSRGSTDERRLWLINDDLDTLMDWRRQTGARLLLSLRSARVGGGPERLAANLRERGIDGLVLPHGEWRGGLVALLHRFERYAVATGPVHAREMAKLFPAGVDGISTDHPDRLAAVGAQYGIGT